MGNESVPMLKLLQKQATPRETDKQQIECNTAMAVENKRSIKQIDEHETSKMLVVNGIPDVWKGWQRDQ
eukprot:2066425-Karenia_brevis.AAC.1